MTEIVLGLAGRKPRATHHVLHTNTDLPIAVERPVVAHNVRGVTGM